MTRQEAVAAMGDRSKVETGPRGSADYDTGRIVAVDADIATVAWTRGIRTNCPIGNLRASS